MSEWWTYRLSSFLLFSQRTYDRLFELYNADVWPAQAATLAVGAALIATPGNASPARTRASVAALAALGAVVAWAFQHRRYATINWAAEYYAVAFALEAAVLALATFSCARAARVIVPRSARWIGRALMLVGVVAYPLLPLVAGRDWRQAEVFGLAPDPTAIATLGLLLLVPVRARGVVAAIPLLWCATSGLFLWPMRASQAALPLAAAVAALGALTLPRK